MKILFKQIPLVIFTILISIAVSANENFCENLLGTSAVAITTDSRGGYLSRTSMALGRVFSKFREKAAETLDPNFPVKRMLKIVGSQLQALDLLHSKRRLEDSSSLDANESQRHVPTLTRMVNGHPSREYLNEYSYTFALGKELRTPLREETRSVYMEYWMTSGGPVDFTAVSTYLNHTLNSGVEYVFEAPKQSWIVARLRSGGEYFLANAFPQHSISAVLFDRASLNPDSKKSLVSHDNLRKMIQISFSAGTSESLTRVKIEISPDNTRLPLRLGDAIFLYKLLSELTPSNTGNKTSLYTFAFSDGTSYEQIKEARSLAERSLAKLTQIFVYVNLKSNPGLVPVSTLEEADYIVESPVSIRYSNGLPLIVSGIQLYLLPITSAARANLSHFGIGKGVFDRRSEVNSGEGFLDRAPFGDRSLLQPIKLYFKLRLPVGEK